MRVESPVGLKVPVKWVGAKAMVLKAGALSSSLVMRWSRAELPLWPLRASTTMAPVVLPVAGSKSISPCWILKVPCTTWRTSPRVKCTSLWAGSRESFSCAWRAGVEAAAMNRSAFRRRLRIAMIPGRLQDGDRLCSDCRSPVASRDVTSTSKTWGSVGRLAQEYLEEPERWFAKLYCRRVGKWRIWCWLGGYADCEGEFSKIKTRIIGLCRVSV